MDFLDTSASVAAELFPPQGTTTYLQDWQKQQLQVATGVTQPEHSATYVSIIEELEAENRMLRARNERLTMAMKHLERIIQENVR